MSFNLDRTLADELEALKFGPVAEYRDDVTLGGLRYFKTKLLCKQHGLQTVTDTIEGTLTVALACGCRRELGKRAERHRRLA